ncbi:hypothetical protein YPPY89_1392, partial [Yersinia pestis PY-89]
MAAKSSASLPGECQHAT